MDLLEIGKAIGRVEAKLDCHTEEFRKFAAIQGEKNKAFEETQSYVSNVRRNHSRVSKFFLWVLSFFGGGHQ